ncbi:MAG: beta-1,6-N-acetylglucosaminyltransferase [Actinomycetota bacterium]|nr:beta-1,6-N-acetylglucosaminyltransferase [Actinomycetota bacterium]
MRIDYLIRAHTAPAQLARLVERLDEGDARFYVHVNRLTDDETFGAMQEGLRGRDNVVWLPRVACYWGGFSLLQATLVGIEGILARGDPPDYALLLSGQDYPLRPPRELEAFLEARRGRSFLHNFRLPAEEWAGEGGGLNRVRYPHFERIRYKTHLLRLPFPRRFPPGLEPYGGMALWALTGDALAAVMRFVAERPDVLRFFRRTKMPDELFFQTIVLSTPLATTVENELLHYVDWSAGSAHPATLRAADLPMLRASGKLFARKFDASVDSEILDLLDREPANVA